MFTGNIPQKVRNKNFQTKKGEKINYELTFSTING